MSDVPQDPAVTQSGAVTLSLKRFNAILAHARAQALRDAAETIPEVGDVLRGMAAREVGGDE